jgi:hypothetical protein
MDDQQPHSLIASHDAPDVFDASDAFEVFATPGATDDPAPDSPESPDAPDASEGPVSQQEVVFLTPSPSVWRLAESIVYRPGALVAVALLAGPVVCAIAGAVAADVTGSVPVWLPLVLLLWLPALALAWMLLKSVRVTPDALACGRPLGQWRVILFDEIERVERHGLRLVVRARGSRPLAFTPLLLHRGAYLRRSLLLRLPLTVLIGELRAQALSLSEGDVTSRIEGDKGDISGILTVRPRLIWSVLAGSVAVALIALGTMALLAIASPASGALALALAALAGALGYFSLWSAQEIFVSEKGLVIRYALLRRERDVHWAQVSLVEYTPGEMTLLFRGVRQTTICAGPGLLNAPQARLMRQFVSRYCLSQVAPALTRRPL